MYPVLLIFCIIDILFNLFALPIIVPRFLHKNMKGMRLLSHMILFPLLLICLGLSVTFYLQKNPLSDVLAPSIDFMLVSVWIIVGAHLYLNMNSWHRRRTMISVAILLTINFSMFIGNLYLNISRNLNSPNNLSKYDSEYFIGAIMSISVILRAIIFSYVCLKTWIYVGIIDLSTNKQASTRERYIIVVKTVFIYSLLAYEVLVIVVLFKKFKIYTLLHQIDMCINRPIYVYLMLYLIRSGQESRPSVERRQKLGS
eukprot:TRINITY_DN4329_c0_g1_i1.p1 TRINITY_DN4329_c0_g1~~TRINITY_DN4329_c0_g1_i1.p1  ORF type:complete len:256 (-),score=5.86 TRINITY_DN4329_c0_g1_i1:177-944(-)